MFQPDLRKVLAQALRNLAANEPAAQLVAEILCAGRMRGSQIEHLAPIGQRRREGVELGGENALLIAVMPIFHVRELSGERQLAAGIFCRVSPHWAPPARGP